MDQIEAMRLFVRVVQKSSFSAVAREKGTSQATVSKKMAALEEKLGIRLLIRTSREVTLTPEGEQYYSYCQSMLEELDEVEWSLRSKTSSPKGVIRVSAPVAFGRLLLAPHIQSFLQQYPDIRLDLSLNDRHVDFVTDGIDVAIRARQLEDSNLIARKLFDNPMLLVAAPNYLELNGSPEYPKDLSTHNCIVYSLFQTAHTWHLKKDGQASPESVSVSGRFVCDNGDTILETALQGVGIAALPVWMVKKHLDSGALTHVLPDYQGDNLPFHAVYLQSRYTPQKIRCFVDFLLSSLRSA